MQLGLAVVPLVLLTGSKAKIGEFVNGQLVKTGAWTIAGTIIVLKVYLPLKIFGIAKIIKEKVLYLYKLLTAGKFPFL